MTAIDTTQLIIGEEPQYFFDNGIVERVSGVTRTLHSPEKVSTNPLIGRDRPWEHVTYFSCNTWTLWRDAATGRFHCLYTDWRFDRDRAARSGGLIVDWDNARLRQLYASSEDGVQWIKPALGFVREGGAETNVVFGSEDFGSAYNFTVIEDPLVSDPERRYKSLYTYIPRTVPATAHDMRVAYSPDGVQWRPAEERPTFGAQGAQLGDVAITDYDPTTRTYLLFTRHPWQAGAPSVGHWAADTASGGTPRYDEMVGISSRRNRRRIFLCESADFIHWSDPRLVLAPDPEVDNLDDAFYGMTPLRLGAQWIGFLNCFHMVSNTMNVELVHSRDGRTWRRVRPMHAWLDCGQVGAFDEFMVNVPSRPVTVGEEVFVYYGGAKNHHDWWFAGPSENREAPHLWSHAPEVTDWSAVGYHLGLAKLRRDGYVSLDARREREGVLVTQPFVSPGDALVINAACGKDGYVTVEALDVFDQGIPGHAVGDCDAFTGDATAHTVTWRGDATLHMPDTPAPGGAKGPTPYRRLRFVMRDAQLYSFRVARSSAPQELSCAGRPVTEV